MKLKHGKYESSLGNKQHQPQIMVMNSIATLYAFCLGGRVGNYKNHHDWDAWLQIGQFESPPPQLLATILPAIFGHIGKHHSLTEIFIRFRRWQRTQRRKGTVGTTWLAGPDTAGRTCGFPPLYPLIIHWHQHSWSVFCSWTCLMIL